MIIGYTFPVPGKSDDGAAATSAPLMMGNSMIYPSSWAETVALVVVAATISRIACNGMVDFDRNGQLLYRDISALLILLPLTWAGLRGHQRDAAATAFTFCAFVIWGLQARSNPLPAIELNRSLVLVASLSAGFWSRLSW